MRSKLEQCRAGYAVLLTNDSSYWKVPTQRDTVDTDFRVHEGREISGALAWAARAVEAGSQSESSVADAAGPDTFSFEPLLRLLASSMGVRRWFPHTPPRVGLALTGLVGLLMRDMALTHDEVVGLMDGLLTSGEPPTGTTRLADWLAANGDGLGRRYVSELRRNY